MTVVHQTPHEHPEFTTASFIGATTCDGCGAYIHPNKKAEHIEFHTRLAAAEHLLNGGAVLVKDPSDVSTEA